MNEIKQIPKYNEMRILISKMPKALKQIQAYFAVSYACAARIGEVLRPDASKNPDFEGVPSVCRENIKFEDTEHGERLLITLRTEKQKYPGAQRTVPISLNKRNTAKGFHGERWLGEIIMNFVEDSNEEELFPFSTRWGHFKCRKFMGFNPHVFRYARATHYLVGEVTGEPLSPELVKRIGGWSNLTILSHVYGKFISYKDVSAQLG